MLKANEIRLGNKVYYNTGEAIEIDTIDYLDIKIAVEDNDAFNLSRKPIPITEDILLKIGFTKEYDYRFFKYFNYGTREDWDKIYCDTQNIDLEQCIDGEIRKVFYNDNGCFLHQLQNLYFSITNEELTINL
jgi:hypothetical protein